MHVLECRFLVFSSVMTVLVLTCKTRAVSRMPLAFIAMSTICWFDRRRLPWVAIVQEEGTTGTGLLAAAVPLLPLPSLAMTDNIGPSAVGTMQDLENHDDTRSC